MTPDEGTQGWDALARGAARERAGVDAEVAALRRLLCFGVDGASYALPVESVREIVRVRPIAPVPRVTRCVLGVISLRGEILQVVDLRLRMGLDPAEVGRATRIVVVHSEEGRVAALLVDSVREVIQVSDDELGPSPAADGSGLVQALCTRGDSFVSLLDPERVLELDADA